MGTLTGFNATAVPEMQTYDPLPKGDYTLVAVAAETKFTKSGDGQFLQFTLEVLDGPYKGKKLWVRLNLWNKNQIAVDIAQRELGAFCRAVGIVTPDEPQQLLHRPFIASVGIEKGDRSDQNKITKYAPIAGVAPMAAAPQPAPAAPAAPTAGPAPWGGHAPAAAPAAHVAPPAAPATGVPPWQRPAA